jgi:hypothetical protein
MLILQTDHLFKLIHQHLTKNILLLQKKDVPPIEKEKIISIKFQRSSSSTFDSIRVHQKHSEMKNKKFQVRHNDTIIQSVIQRLQKPYIHPSKGNCADNTYSSKKLKPYNRIPTMLHLKVKEVKH